MENPSPYEDIYNPKCMQKQEKKVSKEIIRVAVIKQVSKNKFRNLPQLGE